MRKYGSDLVVDLMRAYGIRYAAMNPGASYRGLHDSLVNWGTGGPEMIICTNEKIAVGMAHGYARVTGEPMAAIIHDVVGLMQATMGIYTAYTDQTPVLVFGGTGPMAVAKRRPHIEWVHTAHLQGDLVRNFVKWDDQPFDHQAVVDGFARAYQLATMQPCGPVYSCYDLALQEEPLDNEPEIVVHQNHPEQQFPAEERILREIARSLVAAERPVIVAGRVGRRPGSFAALAQLAEVGAIAVYDQQWRNNMPNTHAQHFLGQHCMESADAVLALDVADIYGAVTTGADRSEQRRWLPQSDAKLMEIRIDLLEGNGWSPKFEKYQRVDMSVMANTALALPRLAGLVSEMVAEPAVSRRVEARRRDTALAHDADRARYREQARERWEDKPISTPRLAGELRDAVRDHDWVLSGSSLAGWIPRLWNIDEWHRFSGRSLGTATQIGIGMGVALAHKDSSRLVVHIQPDGDLLFDPGTLWTIARHRLPMLVVMYNNHAYYNDWEHQKIVARDRGRDVLRANIGMDLDEPAPDFATIARGFGWQAMGPITEPDQLADKLKWAVDVVAKERVPVLVDVVTQHR